MRPGESAASLLPCTETISTTGSKRGSGATFQSTAIGPPAGWCATVSVGVGWLASAAHSSAGESVSGATESITGPSPPK